MGLFTVQSHLNYPQWPTTRGRGFNRGQEEVSGRVSGEMRGRVDDRGGHGSGSGSVAPLVERTPILPITTYMQPIVFIQLFYLKKLCSLTRRAQIIM